MSRVRAYKNEICWVPLEIPLKLALFAGEALQFFLYFFILSSCICIESGLLWYPIELCPLQLWKQKFLNTIMKIFWAELFGIPFAIAVALLLLLRLNGNKIAEHPAISKTNSTSSHSATTSKHPFVSTNLYIHHFRHRTEYIWTD